MKLRLAIAVLFTVSVVGCASSASKPYSPSAKRRGFGLAYRQLAPDPVYKRTRLVYLPEPLPSANIEGANAPKFDPVIQLELKNLPIEQAADTFASAFQYKAFCEAKLIGRKLSFNGLGTMEELAGSLGKQEDIKVDIDHSTHTVRFMAKDTTPQFYSREVLRNEQHKSHY